MEDSDLWLIAGLAGSIAVNVATYKWMRSPFNKNRNQKLTDAEIYAGAAPLSSIVFATFVHFAGGIWWKGFLWWLIGSAIYYAIKDARAKKKAASEDAPQTTKQVSNVNAEVNAIHRMALRERDDQIQRLKFENEMLQDQLHSKRKPARHKPKAAPKITGKFGTFEFDYIDAEGNFSHRVVDANAIEEERFSGYCHEAGAIRTFRFENVMGDLVNTETGEMLDAELWADGVRRNHAIY